MGQRRHDTARRQRARRARLRRRPVACAAATVRSNSRSAQTACSRHTASRRPYSRRPRKSAEPAEQGIRSNRRVTAVYPRYNRHVTAARRGTVERWVHRIHRWRGCGARDPPHAQPSDLSSGCAGLESHSIERLGGRIPLRLRRASLASARVSLRSATQPRRSDALRVKRSEAATPPAGSCDGGAQTQDHETVETVETVVKTVER